MSVFRKVTVGEIVVFGKVTVGEIVAYISVLLLNLHDSSFIIDVEDAGREEGAAR